MKQNRSATTQAASANDQVRPNLAEGAKLLRAQGALKPEGAFIALTTR